MYTEIVAFYIPLKFSGKSIAQLTKDLLETTYYYFDRNVTIPEYLASAHLLLG